MTAASAQDFSVARLFNLGGKTALVTGGSSGIGLEMARGLLRNGARVIIASHSRAKLDEALAELNDYPEVQAFEFDITAPEDRLGLAAEVEQRFGSLYLLINNAGTNWGAKLEDYPDAGFAKVMDTNVNAQFALTRDLAPLLAAAGNAELPARIINIGSMDGLHVPIVQRLPTFAYSASKAALHHLTRALAVELAPRHITVNAVAPGFFASRMTRHVFEHYLADIEADCPLGRIGKSEEIVGIVTYLASRPGSYTTGAVIPVDGGTSISKGHRDYLQQN